MTTITSILKITPPDLSRPPDIELPDGSLIHIPSLCGSVASRLFPDTTYMAIEKMLFTNRLCIAYAGSHWGIWDDSWCFEKNINVLEVMKNWNPYVEKEPVGWHRHPASGRRRIDGDPGREYITDHD